MEEHGFLKILRLYWGAYGGASRILTTPYFYISVFVTAVVNQSWLNPNWWDTVISTLPNIIGFSIGGYAIWLGWGDDKFKAIISGQSDSESRDFSPYMEVSATFVHFIIVQFLALFVAILAKGLFFVPADHSYVYCLVKQKYLLDYRSIPWGLGYFLFIYALMTAVASVFALFRITHWFDKYQTRRRAIARDPAQTKQE